MHLGSNTRNGSSIAKLISELKLSQRGANTYNRAVDYSKTSGMWFSMALESVSIAIVGGGLFGCATAILLSRRGHHVELFERRSDILLEASRGNHARLHLGYHYPRSVATALSAREALESFLSEFGMCIRPDITHVVGIAKEGSRTDVERYLTFCDALDLPYVECWPRFVRRDMLAGAFRVREMSIDLDALRRACWAKLHHAGVRVHLCAPTKSHDLRRYAKVVYATYSSTPLTLFSAFQKLPELRFAICEKIILKRIPELDNSSFIVLDGPFFGFDPFDGSGLLIMGDVLHGTHASTVGLSALIPRELYPLINQGIVDPIPASKAPAFLKVAKDFVPAFETAVTIGSLFTVRTVLSGVETTDERPSLVQRIDSDTIVVVGGKLVTCMKVASEIEQLVAGG